MKPRHILANRRLALVALLVVFLAPGMALAQSIERIWHSNVRPTAAVLSMVFNDNGQASRVWFDLGTNANLSGARRVGDLRQDTYGRAQSHATLSGLKPNTVYYYRATISTPNGTASSGIQSFKTKSAAAQ
jgi:phosphodiesterase/alkaline phosphatase D-like protein